MSSMVGESCMVLGNGFCRLVNIEARLECGLDVVIIYTV